MRRTSTLVAASLILFLSVFLPWTPPGPLHHHGLVPPSELPRNAILGHGWFQGSSRLGTDFPLVRYGLSSVTLCCLLLAIALYALPALAARLWLPVLAAGITASAILVYHPVAYGLPSFGWLVALVAAVVITALPFARESLSGHSRRPVAQNQNAA